MALSNSVSFSAHRVSGRRHCESDPLEGWHRRRRPQSATLLVCHALSLAVLDAAVQQEIGRILRVRDRTQARELLVEKGADVSHVKRRTAIRDVRLKVVLESGWCELKGVQPPKRMLQR
eukprot:6177869-Pleurochrysis_carterae.AAC.2